MEYYSTVDKSRRVPLAEAVMRSIAPDGGLYMPAMIPQLPKAFFNNISELSLGDIGYVITNTLFGSEIGSETIKKIISDTLSFEMPLKRVGEGKYGLELFHGPTLAFKDVGARFMARLSSHFSKGKGCNVLVATSGDTGGAVANGFYNLPGVNVFVLYPMRKMSRFQEAQFTTLGGNIHALAINGDFDDCHDLVRQVFMDSDLATRLNLVSVNSINVARLLPQTIYYFHAWARLPEHERRRGNVVFSVPSGNLGNLVAGVIAKRMGLPVSRFIAVNNSNDIFTEYLRTGRYLTRPIVRTLANAMDVGDPSNFGRLLDLYDGDHKLMAGEIQGVAYNDVEIGCTIRDTLDSCGLLLDPHGASALQGLHDCLASGETGIFLATAHPAKYQEEVEHALGRKIAIDNPLKGIAGRSRNIERIAPNVDALKKYIITHAK